MGSIEMAEEKQTEHRKTMPNATQEKNKSGQASNH